MAVEQTPQKLIRTPEPITRAERACCVHQHPGIVRLGRDRSLEDLQRFVPTFQSPKLAPSPKQNRIVYDAP